MNMQRPLATIGLMLGLVNPVLADSVVARSYTSAKLDALWRGTLGTTSPDAAAFTLLAPGPTAPPPVTAAPVTNFGLPFTGVVLGESAPTAGTAQVRAFPVIPMTREEASVLNRRLAWAEIYLSRYRYYEPVSTDGAEVITTLTERQYAAALEAYLITARLYYAAPDLPEKCQRLTRMSELVGGALSGISATALPQDWRALATVQIAAAARLGDAPLAALVCSVEPVRGRAETVRLVETRVRERIMGQVRAKVDDTLSLLDASAAQFTALVNQMDVPILSAEIIELERVLGNAAANMMLVKEDQLRAAETIARLQAVDLSALNQPTSLQEFETGKTRMQAMSGLIDGVMTALADLPTAVDDSALQAELAPCAALRGAYPALDLTRDTATLTQAISAPYEDCLTHARSVVLRFQNPSLQSAQMAALAHHVRQISETYLSTVSP